MKNKQFTKTLIALIATVVITVSTINPVSLKVTDNGIGIEIETNSDEGGDEAEGSFIY